MSCTIGFSSTTDIRLWLSRTVSSSVVPERGNPIRNTSCGAPGGAAGFSGLARRTPL